MPDITLCLNVKCPLRNRCGRFLGKPDDMWQSFANFQPKEKPFGGYGDRVLDCDYFWDVKDYPYKLKG